uniref:SH3 domain-containing protein n=1 Tax=Monopterus albus TaxID=43700 RepID=A0A3Q3ITX9_MONAL
FFVLCCGHCAPQSKLAKALYDNTAECADELAFRKGDIVTVINQNVAGTSGWWLCSLYGQQGLAPANRLQLLPHTGTTAHCLSHVTENFKLTDTKPDDDMENIYQIPSVPRLSSSPAYERMDMIYKVPSTPLSASISPVTSALNTVSSPRGEVYDVPSPARRGSAYIIYAVPPPLTQDPSYDIPVPSATEAQQKMISGYSTLPNLHKPEWIYNVPVSPERQSSPQGSHDTIPSKTICRQLYDTLPARAWPSQRGCPTSSFYDVPKPISLDIQSLPKDLPMAPINDKPPAQTLTEESIYDVPSQEEPLNRALGDPPGDHIPLECRGDSSDAHELKGVCLHQMRNFLVRTSFHDLPGTAEFLLQEDKGRGRIQHCTAAGSLRISTASSSSTSSCDSLALSSSSPEPLREVTLSQDEACRKLLDLQESICRAVPQLMKFVSSNWRSKEHLKKHLNEIKVAADGIAFSLTCFLNFALDIKGNAHRLTDTNLQTRLYKQLSIIENSSVILQQTVSALNTACWPLSILCQEPGQVHTPDQLERFVMVARTVPDDIKRLVSIINANGKLLFRAPQKDPDPINTTSQPETKKSPNRSKQGGDLVEDENDYVELQSSRGTEKHRPPSMSEHCRLYFGALQKALRGFVGSLQDGQPPEKFISQSKLVIMVGQKLLDTLCREAQRGESNHSLLCKSSQLCALLKQLAVATKKAALHFPDKQALHEAQEFAKELAQGAQHFRTSLDL